MRPDHARFTAFTTHLTQLDPALNAFASANGFTVEANAFHQPCRYLSKPGNPHWLIVIALDRDWRVSQLDKDMEHTVTAIAYYFPPNDPTSVWREAKTLAKSVPFSQLILHINDILREALNTLRDLSGEAIMRTGTREENLEFKYKEQR
jgi:hypothetical protein